MFLPSNDESILRGIVMYTDAEKPVLTKILWDEVGNYEDDDDYITASITFEDDIRNEGSTITFYIAKYGHALSIDEMEVDSATLDVEQDGDEDDTDYHYSYAETVMIYFANGDKRELKISGLPSKNLIQALKIVFMKILRNAD